MNQKNYFWPQIELSLKSPEELNKEIDTVESICDMCLK